MSCKIEPSHQEICGWDHAVADKSATQFPIYTFPDAFTEANLNLVKPDTDAGESCGPPDCPGCVSILTDGQCQPPAGVKRQTHGAEFPRLPIPEECEDPSYSYELYEPSVYLYRMVIKIREFDTKPYENEVIVGCGSDGASYHPDISCGEELGPLSEAARRPDGKCCIKSPGNADGGIPVCIDWRGCSNIPIYGEVDPDCDNCGLWNFSMQCDEEIGGDQLNVQWSYDSRIHPEIPACERQTIDPGDGGGGFGAISINDLISNETTNSILIDDSNLECEDGACLWECMDDGEKTYYGILLDDSDCSRRIKPCGCPDVGPDGPCVPGDIIATACGG